MLIQKVNLSDMRLPIFVNEQLGTQFFFVHLFIPVLYMFRATKCSSSGESIVSIQSDMCHSM